MEKYVQKANAEIVKALSKGDDVRFAKVGELYIVTIPPFAVGHILRESEVFFALDKAKQTDKLAGLFTELLNLEKTMTAENKISATGNYYAPPFARFQFMKELRGKKYGVWIDSSFAKDIEPCSYYQESRQTAKTNREVSPILAVVDGIPARIILPVRKV